MLFLQCNCLQCSLARAYTRKLSSLDVSSSPSVDSHGIAERQCLCQRSKQAFTFKLVFQELPRLVDLVSWWQQSARVGFLIALHHRGSISCRDVTDVHVVAFWCQRRTGLQEVARAVHRLCQRQQNPNMCLKRLMTIKTLHITLTHQVNFLIFTSLIKKFD